MPINLAVILLLLLLLLYFSLLLHFALPFLPPYYYINDFEGTFMASMGPWFTMSEKSRKSQWEGLEKKVIQSWCLLKSSVWAQRTGPFTEEALEVISGIPLDTAYPKPQMCTTAIAQLVIIEFVSHTNLKL